MDITFLNSVAKSTVLGAISGLIAAAHVDYSAFQAWKSADEAMKYDWYIAGWRWFKGFVTGAVTGWIGGSVI